MLRWMCVVTNLDKIRNERIRGTSKVGGNCKASPGKEVEVIYWHAMTREEQYVGRRVMVRKRGRPQRRWLK